MKAHVKAILAGVGVISSFALVALALDRWAGPAQTSPIPPATTAPGLGSLHALRLEDASGVSISLAKYQGKLLVLNFWATWCAPCLEEMPMLSAMQTKHAANGLQIVGIAADSAVKVRKYANEAKIVYPLFPDEAGAITLSKTLGNRFGLLPHTVAYAPNGDQVFAKLGQVTAEEIESIVSKFPPNSR